MTTHYIHFFVGINDGTASALRNQLLNAAFGEKADKIVLLMNSTGGTLHQAFGLYNLMRILPAPLEVHNMGGVDSAALLIYLGAPIRYATAGSRFLIHAIKWDGGQNASVDAARFAEHADRLVDDRKRFTEVFNQRTHGAQSPLEIEPILLGGHLIVDSAAAAAAGITTGPATTVAFDPDAKHWWTNV